MANVEEIEIWAEGLENDPIKGNPQRSALDKELILQGWLRLEGVTAQQLNQLFNQHSHFAPPSPVCPYEFPASAILPSTALYMNGQALDIDVSPVLFNTYGANLPVMTSPNEGFVYIVRNH